MTAYYNEHDPFAAAWLRELIADGLIAPGVVDERSIEDVKPDDLSEFVQCHFFAGIGIWSLALRRAGWPDERPIWTGSCPCQPFSAAGKGGGFDDERHLWPAFHWLIAQCRPAIVVGEQVASKDGLGWLDLVSADLEGTGYAFGAVDTCAAGFGAPHIRQRLYWVAEPDDAFGRPDLAARHFDNGRHAGWTEVASHAGVGGESLRPGPTNDLWRAADWLFCTDGRWRPVEPGTFPLAHGRAFRNRVAELRGAGNAIVLAQAQGFIEAVIGRHLRLNVDIFG
jgi:DNA (cytosine-5)-methyltransferase 1